MKDTKKPAGRKPMRAKTGGDKGGKFGPGKGAGARPAKGPGGKDKNPAHLEVTGEGERISKIMARAGVASRRDCERMILEGRVSLNGKVLTTPAVNCTPDDKIEVDGQPIGAIERTRLWIYYKPAGLVTTNYDPEGRPTVFDNLPEDLPRVISVGRLDINTEGLLLLTNDGGLARMLELPTTGWLRRYRVRAYGAINQEKLDSLKEGIAVDGVFYGAIEATLDRQQGHNVWITMGLREGKNREIKNVLGALGLDVNRLIRISYGPFQLGELEEGDVVEVRSRTLREQLGPRLIAEANANFEAPINNLPKDAGDEKTADKPEAAERPRRESREDRRERDLARIDTKRPAKGEARGKGDWAKGDRDRGERGGDRDRGGDRERRGRDDDRRGDRRDEKPKRPPLGTIRTANVWIAPGGRPAETETSGDVITDRAGRQILRVRKPKQEAEKKPSKPKRPAAAKARRDERGDAGRDERDTRAPRRGRDDATGGERARSARPGGKPDFQERGDAPKRSFGKGKPDFARDGDKRRDDRPRADRPRDDKPRQDRPQGDKRRDDSRRDDTRKPGGRRLDARSGEGRSDDRGGPRKGGPGGKGVRGGGADRRR
jgi:23S rRNA pseudouridine2605 synthase